MLGRILRRPFFWLLMALGAAYGTLALAGGYGTDADAYAMARSGIDVLRGGAYMPSRPPGYPLPELVISAAMLLGGAAAANLLSAALACLALFSFHRLLREAFGERAALLAAAVVGVNPYWMLAATGSMDYVYAAAFALAGLACLRANRPMGSALLFAAAIASRATWMPLCAAGAGAIWTFWRPPAASRARWMGAALACAALFAAAYVPVWRALGRGMFEVTVGAARVPFFAGDGFASFTAVLARFAYKNVFLWGLPAFLLVCAALPGIARAWRTGGPKRRAGLVLLACGLLYVEALFWRLPLEVPYLLPAVFLVAAALAFLPGRGVLVALLITAQCAQAWISFDLVEVRYARRSFTGVEATGMSFRPGFREGPVLRDLRERPAARAHFLKSFGLEELR